MMYILFGLKEVRILPLFLVMTSFVIIGLLKLAYFVEQLASYNFLGCLDQILQRMEGGGGGEEKENRPVLYRDQKAYCF